MPHSRRAQRAPHGAAADGRLFFVHLHAPYETLADRMTRRTRHFMPASLLQSQLDTLEPLGADEPGVVVDASTPLEDVVTEAVRAVRAS